jgi:hypothetical protein
MPSALPMNPRLALLVLPLSAAMLGCPVEVDSSSRGSSGSTGSMGSGGAGGSGISGLPDVHVVCEDRVEYCSDTECPRLTATYGYDEGARLVSYVETYATGYVGFALTRGYDGAGRRVRQDEVNHYSEPLHRGMSWEYDDSGRVARATYEGWHDDAATMSSKLLETRYFYDEKGHPARFETSEDGALTQVIRVLRIEGEPLVIEQVRDTGLDGAVERQQRCWLAQGRWVTQCEYFHDDVVVARESYTYADQSLGQVSGRDFDIDADGVADEKDELLWDASGRVQHRGFDLDGDGDVDQTDDYQYDAGGRLTARRWKVIDGMGSMPSDVTSTVDWSDGLIHRVERGDTATHAIWESWTFTRGCSGDAVKDVAISPAHAWTYELTTVPFSVDGNAWWGFPDAL